MRKESPAIARLVFKSMQRARTATIASFFSGSSPTNLIDITSICKEPNTKGRELS